jgi:hypothetical protein
VTEVEVTPVAVSDVPLTITLVTSPVINPVPVIVNVPPFVDMGDGERDDNTGAATTLTVEEALPKLLE